MSTSVSPSAFPRRGAVTVTELRRTFSDGQIRAQLKARRWQRIGNAVVAHNGPLTRHDVLTLALANHGQRSALTSFTALTGYGVTGWSRDSIFVIAPIGTRRFRSNRLPPIVLCQSGSIQLADRWRAETPAAAAVRAASSLAEPRHAAGLLAAVVQQGKADVRSLLSTVDAATRARHRRAMLAALRDIEQGAHALSEIDFIRLCRHHRLPPPRQQAVRRDPSGRRRYLDAVWDLPNGRILIAEVDGDLHVVQASWWKDQLRQNDLALSGAMILRFPSAIVRQEPGLVASQLRRPLTC